MGQPIKIGDDHALAAAATLSAFPYLAPIAHHGSPGARSPGAPASIRHATG